MAGGVNKVILIGNLGRDPEVRYTKDGQAIATLSVATTRTWFDKQKQEKREETEWHRVKVFGKQAENCGEYLSKGRQVYVEGRLKTDKYTDKQGVERYTTDVIAENVQFLGGGGGGRRDRNEGGPPDDFGGGGGNGAPTFDGGENDIPF